MLPHHWPTLPSINFAPKIIITRRSKNVTQKRMILELSISWPFIVPLKYCHKQWNIKHHEKEEIDEMKSEVEKYYSWIIFWHFIAKISWPFSTFFSLFSLAPNFSRSLRRQWITMSDWCEPKDEPSTTSIDSFWHIKIPSSDRSLECVKNESKW